MKSKTAAAIAASMMALCLPAKAVTVDAATPVEIFFTIPPGLLPTVLCCGVSDATLTLNFNAADPLGSFDVMTLQWFDANHTLLDATQPAHKGDVTTISVDSFFSPLLMTSSFSVVVGTSSGSFDLVSAVSNIVDDSLFVMVGEFATPASVPGPIVGAGLPGLIGMLGYGGWKWRRRKKIA